MQFEFFQISSGTGHGTQLGGHLHHAVQELLALVPLSIAYMALSGLQCCA